MTSLNDSSEEDAFWRSRSHEERLNGIETNRRLVYGHRASSRLQRYFLKLLNSLEVEYLLVGGYAVGFYGYPRATADMDIWIDVSRKNASKMNRVMTEFGIGENDLDESLACRTAPRY